jgi:hypothetical protein
MTDAAAVPAGRVQLRKAAGVAALLSGIALVVGWFSDWPYMPMLWLWFAFWMAFGHWLFCRSLGVTQRHVRMIDYLYLGAAAVSIALAAGSYEESRALYARMFDEAFIPADRPGLLNYVERQEGYCGPTMREFMPEPYCQWIASIKTFLAGNPGVPDLESQIKESHRVKTTGDRKATTAALRLFASSVARLPTA